MTITTYIVTSDQVNVSGGSDGTVSATCNSGDVVTGGGFDFGNNPNITARSSGPSGGGGTPVAWDVTADNHGTTSQNIQAYAVCQHIT